MNKQNNRVITPEERQTIIDLRLQPNPIERLKNNYYSLCRKEMVTDYYQAFGETPPLYDAEDAPTIFAFGMKQLWQEFIADLQLYFELQLSNEGVYLPWPVKISLESGGWSRE